MFAEYDHIFLNAQAHYNATVCDHVSFVIPDWLEVAMSYEKMKEDDRINVVRSILFALTCPCDRKNDIFSHNLPKKKIR